MSKAIKKHAPAIAAALAGALASSLATLAGTKAPDGFEQSNLGKMAEKVKGAIGQQSGSEAHEARAETKGRRQNESSANSPALNRLPS